MRFAIAGKALHLQGMKAFVLPCLVLAVLAAAACPAFVGTAAAQAEYRGMSPQYGTPPRPDYFYEPNYRPPGKEPNRYDFVIGVDANDYRREDPRPRPPHHGPRPRPPHHGSDHHGSGHYGPDRPHGR